MAPSSLLIAVDMESLPALGIEPHFSTAAVYLDLHLFGCQIHVHIDHFPRCDQLKSLLEKFRVLHGSNFCHICAKNHSFSFCVRLTKRGTSEEADERKRRLPLQRVAKPAQEVTVFCVRQHFARSSLRLSTCKSFRDFVRKVTRGFAFGRTGGGPVFSI